MKVNDTDSAEKTIFLHNLHSISYIMRISIVKSSQK